MMIIIFCIIIIMDSSGRLSKAGLHSFKLFYSETQFLYIASMFELIFPVVLVNVMWVGSRLPCPVQKMTDD